MEPSETTPTTCDSVDHISEPVSLSAQPESRAIETTPPHVETLVPTGDTGEEGDGGTGAEAVEDEGK